MRFATLVVILLALLGGCSSEPTPPTLELGSMVTRSLGIWRYGTTPRYALAEQYQFAGEQAEGWLEPVQQGVSHQLNNKGWRSVPLAEADLWVAIGVASDRDINDEQLFARLGIAPGLQAPANSAKGTIVIVLLDRQTQKAVWSSAISLASGQTITEKQRQQLSLQITGKLLDNVPVQ